MLRALWFLIKAGVLVALALWLAAQVGTGSVSITWRGYLVETTPGVLVLAALGLSAVVMLATSLVRFVFSLPQRWRRFRRDVGREDAYRALTQGLVAVAAGDAKRAEKMLLRAQAALPEQPLTRLLSAQTSLLQGNRAAAQRTFSALAEDPEGAFFGVRGLLADSLSRRDYASACAHLRTADKLQPRRPWIVRSLFDMEARTRDWLGAERTLRRAQRSGAMDIASVKQARQAIWVAQALEIAANKDVPPGVRRQERLRFAEAAYRLNVDFTPAALALADAQIAAGKTNAARKLIRRAWERAPHPQLLLRWQALLPAAKVKRDKIYGEAEAAYHWVGELTALRPEHIESQHALGLAALAARHWRQARPLLQAAGDYRALAELERQETGDEGAARAWLEQAAAAPGAPAWCCDVCGHRDDVWRPLCAQCDSFNRFTWRVPDMQQGHAWQRTYDALLPPDDVLAPPR